MDQSRSTGKKRHPSEDGAEQQHEQKREKRDEGERSDGQPFLTRPHDGARGFSRYERVKLLTNYFELKTTPQWDIHKFVVTFEPECEMKRLRYALLMQHKDQIGGFLFDGTQLFVMRELKTNQGVLQLQSKTRADHF